MGKYQSTKLFDNYSVALRQWKAAHSHCELLHGYALEFKVWFESHEPLEENQLDEMNWIMDYGGFKSTDAQPTPGNGLKDWMDYMWDHTTIVAEDDPELEGFKAMDRFKVIQLRILPATGAERFAEYFYHKINDFVQAETNGRVKVVQVEFREHEKNTAFYKG